MLWKSSSTRTRIAGNGHVARYVRLVYRWRDGLGGLLIIDVPETIESSAPRRAAFVDRLKAKYEKKTGMRCTPAVIAQVLGDYKKYMDARRAAAGRGAKRA